MATTARTRQASTRTGSASRRKLLPDGMEFRGGCVDEAAARPEGGAMIRTPADTTMEVTWPPVMGFPRIALGFKVGLCRRFS